MLFYCFT